MKISATIITFNEEKNIAKAINSLSFVDEILVIDSESTDKTVEIAKSLGAKVITQKWLGFSKQKQFAVDNALHDWIFSLDADEVVSENLINELQNLKNTQTFTLSDAYKIPRLSFYMNRPIYHGGWYPDWQIRFFNRKKAKWKDVLIHESVEVDGRIGKFKSDIWHYSVENASHHHKMIGERYAPLAAEQMFEKGKRTSFFKIATVGLTSFIQNYVIRLGFLDGVAGFVIATFAAHHAFLKYLILYELQQKKIK